MGDDAGILKWFKRQMEEGMAYLKSQPGERDIDVALKIIRGQSWSDDIPEGLSKVFFNRPNRQSEEICFRLSNLGPQCGFDSSATDASQRQLAEMLDKRNEDWLNKPKNRMDIRRWLLESRPGIAYASPVMADPLLIDSRSDDAELLSYGYWDVIPYQIGRDRDIQRAEAVTLVNHVPFLRAQKIYPGYKLKADEELPWYERGWIGKVFEVAADYWSALKAGKDKRGSQRTVRIFHVYVNDKTVNTTGKPITMGLIPNPNWDPKNSNGEPQMLTTPFTYTVPSKGSPIPTNIYEPERQELVNGQTVIIPRKEVTRPATDEDARLYPFRRLLIIANDRMIYDGTSYWAHGLVPLVPYRAIDNPMEYLSGSIYRDVIPVFDSYTEILRGVMNKVKRIQNPQIFYNRKLDADTVKQVTKGIPGFCQEYDDLLGKNPIIYARPPEMDEIQESEFKMLDLCEKMMDYIMGTHDTWALTEKQQIPGSDSIQDILRAEGEIMMDRGRRMEYAWQELGFMLGMLFAQFDSMRRRLRLMGDDGITFADLDYDPTNMIPSHLPGEDTSKDSHSSRLQRTAYYMKQMRFWVEPNTAYGFSNTEAKLETELLRERNFPVSWERQAKLYRIKNFGKVPGNTELEKFENQTKMNAAVQAQAVAIGQSIVQSAQAANPLNQIAQMLQGSQGSGQGAPAQTNPEGRPPSLQQTPQMVQKDGGQRTTLSTSGG